MQTTAKGVNDAGVITGFFQVLQFHSAGGNIVAYINDHGSFTNLAVPGALNTALGEGSFGQDINDAGQVVGYFQSFDGVTQRTHGFLLSGGVYTILDDPLAANHRTFATGINDAGQIVGYYMDAGNHAHGFLFSGGTYTTLDDRHGINGTFVQDINNAGQIVGYYVDADNVDHGFVGQPAGSFDSPTGARSPLAISTAITRLISRSDAWRTIFPRSSFRTARSRRAAVPLPTAPSIQAGISPPGPISPATATPTSSISEHWTG
jgi:probable HAF family extracellular repeat protein